VGREAAKIGSMDKATGAKPETKRKLQVKEKGLGGPAAEAIKKLPLHCLKRTDGELKKSKKKASGT